MKKEKQIKYQIDQLQKAGERLKEALALKLTQINQDASIQRFEFTFELSWKLMRAVADQKGITVFSPKDTIRTAAQLGLIEEVDNWFEYLKARNASSHVYDQKMAGEIYQITKKFPQAVDKLLNAVLK